ncbi:protein NLP7-like [Salvia divinorum]|uniref:Protein NLP7-like n=1 Tax=Salvia divinorum TaxID=28513 RepID=A0ABD1I2M9_SALDI
MGSLVFFNNRFESGWVLYEELEQHKIVALLKRIASSSSLLRHSLMQFWGVVIVEESRHYFTSSRHPFFVSELNEGDDLLSLQDQALQIAGLRSNNNPIAISSPAKEMQQLESEMTEILELAMATIPRLYLAQVWVPCNKLCVNISTNSCCMEMISFIDSQTKMFNSWGAIDDYMHDYLQACEFHKHQIDFHNCHSNLCDFTLSKNPLAHYAQRARMSHCIAVSHQSNTNNLYVIQFFLRPKHKQDGCGDHSLHLLSRILETNLKSVTLLSGKQLVEEYLRRDAIECDSIDSFSLMKSYKQNFLVLNMTTYLKTVDSCCLKPSSAAGKDKGLVFLFPAKHSGIASFRKQCTTYYYYVDDQARQDELGPPGRVFRLGHPEISPDLFYYTREEFPIRNFAMLCYDRGYMALPIFDDEGIGNHKLVGVLEFLGFYYSDLRNIGKLLEATKLYSTHMDFHPRFLANKSVNIVNGRKKALTKIHTALSIINKINPQLLMANVWIPVGDCLSSTNNNMSCMELALSTKDNLKFMPTDSVHWWIHVQARKGIIGMVLASENKSCFCPNLSEFSIVDQPLSHYDMSDRRDVCFAICLQSSHTGYLLYVVEFFLCQETEKRKNSLNLSVEVLQPHFGKKLRDVAEEFGIGRSTIKRACRELGIRRWPNRKEHMKNLYLFEEEGTANSEHDVSPSIGNRHLLDDVTETNTKSPDKVIVKVKYKKHLIKFEFSLSLGLAELTKEVAMSLNLEMGSFKLKYVDEDGDEILLTRAVDLQLCPKSRTTRGEALIRLLVR